MTRNDENDTRGRLDIRRASFGVGSGFYSMKVELYEKIPRRVLRVPTPEQGAIFMYLDTAPDAGRRTAEYRVRIYYYQGAWEARVERLNPAELDIVGFGSGTRLNPWTLRFRVDSGLISLQQSEIWFFAETGFRKKKTKCKSTCWDYAPNRGFVRY